jgi:threonine/homoserine/homoserine lactone efflux protein
MLLALMSYAFVMSITPGPNNVMLLASGVNFGFRRTLPQMLGITAGVIVMLLIVGLGIGQLLLANPRVYLTLKIVSIIYLLWLAWQIASSGPVSAGDTAQGKPMTFLQSALFQWINPKAWAMAVTATTTFTIPATYTPSLVLMALVFGAVNAPSVAVWAAFGVGMRRFLQNPKTLRLFNIAMALVLVASIMPAIGELARLR